MNFNELRQKGENDNFFCKLIREDMVKKFITHINKNCISSNATINPSIFEINSFLLEKPIQSGKNISLIEYAASFGLIQIFTLLENKKAELTPSLWFYAIRSKDAELIHLIEGLHINQTDEKFCKECFNTIKGI